jgi:hypothetical protein
MPAWDIRLAGRDPPLDIPLTLALSDNETHHMSELHHDNPGGFAKKLGLPCLGLHDYLHLNGLPALLNE